MYVGHRDAPCTLQWRCGAGWASTARADENYGTGLRSNASNPRTAHCATSPVISGAVHGDPTKGHTQEVSDGRR